MKIEILKCDLCHSEYRSDTPNYSREIGNIKLDMKGCYYIQKIYEKEVCSKCSKEINSAIYNVINSLTKEKD
jgi:hypothetical protein